MRCMTTAIVLMSLAFTLTGCSGNGPKAPIDPGAGGAEPLPVSFRIVPENEIPMEIRQIIASRMREKTEQAIKAGDGQYIFIALGERRTGGYRVEIRSMESYGGKLRVTYVEVQPPAKSMVTQALTYPWVAAWTSSNLPVEFVCAPPIN